MECEWCGEEGCGPAEVVMSCGCAREQCSSDAAPVPGDFCAACMDVEARATVRAMAPRPDVDKRLQEAIDDDYRADGQRFHL